MNVALLTRLIGYLLPTQMVSNGKVISAPPSTILLTHLVQKLIIPFQDISVGENKSVWELLLTMFMTQVIPTPVVMWEGERKTTSFNTNTIDWTKSKTKSAATADSALSYVTMRQERLTMTYDEYFSHLVSSKSLVS